MAFWAILKRKKGKLKIFEFKNEQKYKAMYAKYNVILFADNVDNE